MTPEFSRIVRVDTLGQGPRSLSFGANEAERAALVRRFGLVSLDRLSAQASISRNGEEVRATGTLTAAVAQSCVATGEPVPQEIDEKFDILFRPHPEGMSEDDEVELSQGELDVVFFDGAAIDIGEAVAETLALSLDPFPRSAEAEEALKKAGVKGEDEVGPSGPLAGLKDLLNKQS